MRYKIGVARHLVIYTAWRAALAAVTVLFVALLVFLLMRLAPGDPAMILTEQRGATNEELAQLRQAMGLDTPVLVQFLGWLGALLTGDLGTSYTQGRPNIDVIGPALLNTLRLGGLAILLAVVLGLALGNLANAPSRIARRVAEWTELIFLSAPQYTVALILMVVFAVLIPVFPSGGLGDANATAGEVLRRLTLPAVALALPFGAQLGRTLKTSIATLRATELLPSLEARGLSPLRLSLHMHQNAVPPMVTVLGFQVGIMLGGAIFVETIFSIPGLGNGIVQAVGMRDYALVQAYTMVIAVVFIVAVLVSDLVNLILDPRMRRTAS